MLRPTLGEVLEPNSAASKTRHLCLSLSWAFAAAAAREASSTLSDYLGCVIKLF